MRALFARLWNSPTFTTWGSLATRFLSVALVLPLALVRLAPAEVAVWQLFASLVTLVLVLDFGLGPTFSRFISYGRGGARLADLIRIGQPATEARSQEADPSTLRAIFATLRWVYLRLSLGGGLLIAVLGTWALQAPMNMLDSPLDGWMAWAAVLVTCTLTFWSGAYAASLQGLDQIPLLRRWEILFALGQILSSAAVLLLGGGLLTLVLATQAWNILAAWRNHRLLKVIAPELMASSPQRHHDVVAAMWPAAWRSGIGVLMSQGVIQASGLIYGQFADAVSLASYLLALRIITLISQFSQAPFYSKLPQLAALQAQGQRITQVNVAQRGMRLAHWVFLIGVVAVAVLAQPLLDLIGSHTPFVSPIFWVAMAMAFFAERYGAMHMQLYTLTNHVIWHIANGVTGVLMLFFAWVLYPWLQLLAFPVGMLIAYLAFYVWYAVRHSRAAFGLHLFSFESRAAIPPALGLFCLAALSLLLQARPIFK